MYRYRKNGMYEVHMACRMPSTIIISIIRIIIQYFFVLNKFSVINLHQKNDGGPQTSKKIMWPSEKKCAPPCSRVFLLMLSLCLDFKSSGRYNLCFVIAS